MSHITSTMDNFTVQSVEYIVEGGDPIDSQTGSQIVMTLVPNVGFAIEASNFTPKSPLPQGITQITFAQDGVNVIMTMDVDANFNMPNNDLTIPICINGSSRQIGVIVKGNVDIQTGLNMTPVSSFPEFENEGALNSTEEIVTQTLQADSGYYFANQPTISLVEGNPDHYSFSVTPSYTVDNDGISRLTSAVCKAFYTYPSVSVDQQEILVFGRVIEIPVLVKEITAYSINQGNIPVTGETRSMSLVGVVGSQYSVTITADVGSNPNFSGTGTNVWSGTMQGSVESESIIFPTVTQDVVYTITITGDLASDFGTNPFTLNQVSDVDFSIEFTTNDYTVTPGELRLQIAPNQSDINPPNGQQFQYSCTITAGTVTPPFGFGGLTALPSDMVKFGNNDAGFDIAAILALAAFDKQSITVSVIGHIFNTEFTGGAVGDFGATLAIDNFVTDASQTRSKTSARLFAYANSTVLCGQSSIVNDGFIFFDGTIQAGSVPPNGTQLYDSQTSSGWSYGAGSFAIFPFGVPGGSGGQDYINVNSSGEVTASGQCSATTGPNSGGSGSGGTGVEDDGDEDATNDDDSQITQA